MSDLQVYVLERDDHICIGNSLVELGFSCSQGAALASIVDKATGWQFRRDEHAPTALYRVGLRRQVDREVEWLDGDQAHSLHWRRREEGDGATLVLVSSDFPDRNLSVTVSVTLAAGSAFSRWRMAVCGVGRAALYELTCPVVSGLFKLGDPAPGESLATPRQSEGYLFKHPFPVRDRLPLAAGAGPEAPDVGVGEIHGKYPGGIAMQLLAYYNDHAGLYLATHDAGQHVKTFDVAPWPEGSRHPAMSVSHLTPETMGQDVALSYDTVLGVFHGDWYDAADIYKGWATKQWWCQQRLWDRDIANWMRTGVGVFQMSNYHLPVLRLNHSLAEIADTVNGLAADSDVPLLALVFNWEHGGGWTGPIGFFPPREGEEPFRDAMRRLREAGNYGFVYITGGNWYLKIASYPFDSWAEFEAEGRPNAIMNAKGEIDIGRWYGGWESVWMCPHTEYIREQTASILLGCLDLGCSIVQIDNFPCSSCNPCHDPTHGHAPGHGPWWSEAWGRILADTRRRAKAKDPNCAITTEGVSENFIPWLDMFDQRAGNMEYFGHYARGDPMGGETIPIFSYVYNEYIGAYCAAYPECNRPEVLYWTRCLGKSLAQSVVPTGGRYFPEPRELNPVTIDFYKKVARAAAHECWPYLMFGEMLRPPAIDVPTITAAYCNFSADCDHMDPGKRHEVTDRAVQHASWRGRDGTVATVFVNISEEPVSFDVELSTYRDEPRPCDVDLTVDGERRNWLRAAALPLTERIDMTPLSVVLVEIREHIDDD